MAPYEDLRADEDSLLAVSGRAWVFGDKVSGRDIVPENILQDAADPYASAMAPLDAEFARRVSAGDFLVAGHEFGFDAAQPLIPVILKKLGLAAVIARSYGSSFARNAIETGLPALVVEETSAIKAGDRLRVDVEAHVVANLSSGDRYVIRNIDDEALAILRAGGLEEYERRRRAASTGTGCR
jgi:3-isopropylmalate/(R)-2-methylmalate dehydratase small subunit